MDDQKNQQEGQPVQETVVVPTEIPQGGITFDPASLSPSAPPPPPPPENPFIPQVAVQAGVSPAPGGGAIKKRILMVFVFLLLVLGLVAGGRFVLGFLSGAKEVTITYWGLWENDATVRSVIADFESKNPKIKVSYVKQSPRQYRERLQAAIARGEGPDVFRFHNTWVAMLAADLAPVPKTVIPTAEFSSTFYPVATNDLVAGATIYGLPMMTEGLGLYINEDLFAKAGVSEPVTWEDVLTIVPKLTVKDGTMITTSAIALGTTGNVENWSDIVALMMLQNGANLVGLTGKEAEETLLFYRKFADPVDPMYTWNETLDNSIYAFAIGKVAMMLAPSWRAFDVRQISPELRFKIVPVPQLPGNTVSWASYWVEGVSGKSKLQPQAFTFLKYLMSRETVTKLYSEAAKTRLFGEVYARTDLGSTIEADPFAGAYAKQAKTAKSFPLASRTFDNGLNDKLIKYLEDAINSVAAGSAPSAALSTASNGFRQVLGQYGLTSNSAPPASQ
ncbi:extracellular solute-binding protein [Candidatus Gottesmanbacteria bacterium]|nr:extracellular solute-binding protein [Candidatus Gottesmanbacteria bacterium]